MIGGILHVGQYKFVTRDGGSGQHIRLFGDYFLPVGANRIVERCRNKAVAFGISRSQYV